MILDCICKYETMMLMNMIKFDKLTLSLPPLGLKSGSVPDVSLFNYTCFCHFISYFFTATFHISLVGH